MNGRWGEIFPNKDYPTHFVSYIARIFLDTHTHAQIYTRTHSYAHTRTHTGRQTDSHRQPQKHRHKQTNKDTRAHTLFNYFQGVHTHK